MVQKCINPYLPLEEYIPDGEPRVFGNRLYIFGSHDRENGNEYCELDYVAWSAPINELGNWRYEGIIYQKKQDPYNGEGLPLYAPDVIEGPDGRYYLYYCIKFQDSINVAVCDTPAGQYQFLGRVCYKDGTVMAENQPYDPSVIYVDGKVFLYFGFAPCMINIPRYKNQNLQGGSVIELELDMLTAKTRPKIVIPSLKHGKGTSFEGNEYFEGPSIRKIGDTFYLVYSSVNTHQLCYARSKKPMEGFEFGGCIISNGDVGYQGRREEDKLMSVGNNHGGLVEVNNQWYIFYHRHTSLNQYSRQACAERVFINENGDIPQVTITTSGMNPEPLPGLGEYPAVYCCNLTNGHMGALSSIGRTNQEIDFPYIICENNERYIKNISNGTLIGYKYINLQETKNIGIKYRSRGEGALEIYTSKDGALKETIFLHSSNEWTVRKAATSFKKEENELYLVYKGTETIELLTLYLKGDENE
ncbi:MAG TPA: family 43 glycosylhydrolase [Candidatus Merdenecus merdavium]|nr:family 43 glycosylhydrolase [Candidatus Merdenecus merdavium]